MSAYRPQPSKTKGSAKRARLAIELAKMRRMIANGSTEQHAFEVMAERRSRRAMKDD